MHVLNEIIRDKTIWLTRRQEKQPLVTFQKEIKLATRNFYKALENSRTVFILECKKASPSKGIIRKDFDPATIVRIYKKYASVISVVTDEKYFQGNLNFLSIVSKEVTQPVFCKDFIINPYQVYLARYYQADAILLMLSVLNDAQYYQLSSIAHSLNMGVLTEVINDDELARATMLGAKVIGINNRDLRDLSIDIERTARLAPKVAPGVIVISESGINNYAKVRKLSQLVHGFLIGSALMLEKDIKTAVRRVIIGDNKVCGLTRAQDAKHSFEVGAIYGGLIFVKGSSRCIDETQAKKIIKDVSLKYVGVFFNDTINNIVAIANRLNLFAIQLHGSEDLEFVRQLRNQLSLNIKIWKGFSITDSLPIRNWPYIDRYLFDNGQGGSGQPFNWNLLKGKKLEDTIIAGGVTVDNCTKAALLGCIGIDFNSGVEIAPGIKDAKKITTVFQRLQDY